MARLEADWEGADEVSDWLDDVADELDTDDGIPDRARRDLSKGLKRSVRARINAKGAVKSGDFRDSFDILRSGKVGVESDLVYAPVLEFAKGKWSSLTPRYGSPPRFAFARIQNDADSAVQRLAEILDDILDSPRG